VDYEPKRLFPDGRTETITHKERRRMPAAAGLNSGTMPSEKSLFGS
jgi:hypothetical protein